MTGSKKKNDIEISRQNISYYDGIAANYDTILDENGDNQVVRHIVAGEFTTLVKGGYVLDFGGGTGRDLGWLIQHSYRISFCEPSAQMRQIAVDKRKKEFPDACISFMDDDKTDFRTWSSLFPFEQKVDAVLANFAVINCIPDIELLFEKLALVIKPGGIVLALILKNSLIKNLRTNLRATLNSFISGNPISIFIDYKGKQQQVYFHSPGAIRKAVAKKFEFIRHKKLHGIEFCLIHLMRK
jgi:SAM-dependent methyltransferase